jgi:hypothetical protein
MVEVLMDDWLIFEFVYIISAFLCAALYPLMSVHIEHSKIFYYDGIRFRDRITYGHIMEGLLLAILPVANTILIGIIIFYAGGHLIISLHKIKVYKGD